MGMIDTILSNTEKGRTLRISLDNGIIRIGCKELRVTDEIRQKIDAFCRDFSETAEVITDTADGFLVSVRMKDG